MQGRFGVTLSLVACLAVVLAPAGCVLAPREPLLTPPQRQLNVESFDRVWTTVNDRYWDSGFGGLDWQAVRDELRPRVEQATTMSETRAVLREMISRLNLSHFAIIPADVYQDLEQPAGGDGQEGEVGIDVRVIDGRALVTSVVKDSPAERLGVRTGWEIIRVGETDIVARLKRLERELPDTPSKRVKLVAGIVGRLDRRVGESVAVTFVDGDDNEIELNVPFAEPRGRQARLGNLGNIRVWIEVKLIDEDVGYIAFNGFINPPYLMKEFNRAIRSFMHADGVIIDLRGNPGGLGAMAMGMAGWLVPTTRQLGTMRMRDDALKLIVQPRPTTYDGPVVILVDGLSGSASEFFAGGLQEMDRACVVGSRTKGEALPGQFTTLPNGDVFLYATANFISAAGKTLEGVGVIPDIEVMPTREGLLQGRDLALEVAIAWIRNQE